MSVQNLLLLHAVAVAGCWTVGSFGSVGSASAASGSGNGANNEEVPTEAVLMEGIQPASDEADGSLQGFSWMHAQQVLIHHRHHFT